MPDIASFSELNYRAVATIYHRLKASSLDDDITIALCCIGYTVLRSCPDSDMLEKSQKRTGRNDPAFSVKSNWKFIVFTPIPLENLE